MAKCLPLRKIALNVVESSDLGTQKGLISNRGPLAVLELARLAPRPSTLQRARE